eukprot:TRINITY_DN18018_c0_g1_i2.p1 TRINITY_DN18018_c0_g1~~TRINITY_DN18018_c0_g1_i2.p1  ORF type:complete len:154 (+),score=25.72 TRINITY_DN18018_c0_g1_i2:57-464(+)
MAPSKVEELSNLVESSEETVAAAETGSGGGSRRWRPVAAVVAVGALVLLAVAFAQRSGPKLRISGADAEGFTSLREIAPPAVDGKCGPYPCGKGATCCCTDYTLPGVAGCPQNKLQCCGAGAVCCGVSCCAPVEI